MAQLLNPETNASADIFHPSEFMRENRREHLHPLLRIAAIGSVALAGLGFGIKAVERNIDPIEKSTSTTIEIAQPGDGVYNIAYRIPGSQEVPVDLLVHDITQDPANIDKLKDGLQVGESLTVPTSVKARR
jgi:hypothetical protein